MLAPSYINILNVYSFCNTHDVTWGTKGSDKADVLPDVATRSAALKDAHGSAIVEEFERDQSEIDVAFEATVKRALAPLKAAGPAAKPSLEDGYKAFRTRLIIAWIFTNLALILGFTSTDIQSNLGLASTSSSRTVIYFNFILWATAILSMIRFTGCVVFCFKTGVLAIPGLSKK